MEETFSPLRWSRGVLYLLDQRKLPGEERWVKCETAAKAARAIETMIIRGAPAIGCTAAYGMALAAREIAGRDPAPKPQEALAFLERAAEMLAATRPTAVNLFWALAQTKSAAKIAAGSGDARRIAEEVEVRAKAIHTEDIAMCRRIGSHGAALLPDDATVLTHCNAGALATGGYGTALGVIRAAREAGKKLSVLADETRPYLQGARLTAWELAREGFDVTLIPDGAAAFLLARGEVSCVVVGADRIAANGDVANKIGTYGLALAAERARVPFYVAAPRSTVDLETATGADIPIEERGGEEVLELAGVSLAPAGVKGRYPAFDITPAELVTAIITDAGVARAPYTESLSSLR